MFHCKCTATVTLNHEKIGKYPERLYVRGFWKKNFGKNLRKIMNDCSCFVC